MMHMSESLGANCMTCHNSRAFNDWDQSPPQRVTAWHGIRMAREINQTYMTGLAPVFPDNRKGPEGDVLKVSCATCHNGVQKPLYGVSMLREFVGLTGHKDQHRCAGLHHLQAGGDDHHVAGEHHFDRTAQRDDRGGHGSGIRRLSLAAAGSAFPQRALAQRRTGDREISGSSVFSREKGPAESGIRLRILKHANGPEGIAFRAVGLSPELLWDLAFGPGLTGPSAPCWAKRQASTASGYSEPSSQ
jgi:hypothetical protein